MSLLFQACRSATSQEAVYLLLALFREVATLYRSHNVDLHPKPQVSISLQGCVHSLMI